MPRIAVLTPSLPERGDMLAEAVASVRAQTLPPVAHLVGVDYDDAGIAGVLNLLGRAADAEWLARLDDDDLLDVNHLEVLAAAADGADVVYSWCRVAGRSGAGGPAPVPGVIRNAEWTPNELFDPAVLRVRNFIPATTLVRRDLWERLGGWPGADRRRPDHGEDYAFWLRALDARAIFRCVPQVTWTYRYHGANCWLR
jgi:GT2 family glycosyltransferase